MIKKAIKYASYVMAVFSVGSLSSCNKDDGDLCYRCTYDGDSYTYCFEDFKDYYGDDFTKSDFEEYIDALEADGYDCTKK